MLILLPQCCFKPLFSTLWIPDAQMLSCSSWLNDMVTHNSVYTFNGRFKMKTPEAQIASVEIVAFLVMLSP